jgi:DNA primase
MPERREVVLVEGLMDVHHLRSKGCPNVAAVGGARIQPGAVTRFRRLGIESVVLAFDNDSPGREGMSRAVEAISRSEDAPALRVIDPGLFAESKDPDAFVQEHGMSRFRVLVGEAGCAITWRARELMRGVTRENDARERRAALARAGEWLGTLPARFALEQEDAVRHVADQCGYSRAAVERAFRARFWNQPSRATRNHPRSLER